MSDSPDGPHALDPENRPPESESSPDASAAPSDDDIDAVHPGGAENLAIPTGTEVRIQSMGAVDETGNIPMLTCIIGVSDGRVYGYNSTVNVPVPGIPGAMRPVQYSFRASSLSAALAKNKIVRQKVEFEEKKKMSKGGIIVAQGDQLGGNGQIPGRLGGLQLPPGFG